jgi:hypothetical protein
MLEEFHLLMLVLLLVDLIDKYNNLPLVVLNFQIKSVHMNHVRKSALLARKNRKFLIIGGYTPPLPPPPALPRPLGTVGGTR